MIGKFLKGSEWANATEYLSPVFFQVVPFVAMTRRFAGLAADYANRERFAALCAAQAGVLVPVGVSLQPGAAAGGSGESSPLAAAHEETVLRLYFWQLLYADTVLLDLRREAFTALGDGRLSWDPKPLYASYDQAFARAIRDLYCGFYLDEPARFDEALAALDLTHARDLFLRHFGPTQTALRFDLQAFRATFHEVFVSCKQAKGRLHPDFLAFGAGLFSLYEHLERAGRAFDVRRAFLDALALGGGVTWQGH